MWVARDKDNSISLYHNKPYRSNDCWKSKYENDIPFLLMENLFPYLSWEDEPEEVFLVMNNTIHKTICSNCCKEFKYHNSDIKEETAWQPGTDGWVEEYIICPNCGNYINLNSYY